MIRICSISTLHNNNTMKLYTTENSLSATLSILITSLSVGIPKLQCVLTPELPQSVISPAAGVNSSDAFHASLPLLHIDRRNNVSSSTSAILLYFSSLQEKLQLVSSGSSDTMEFLDLVELESNDADFLAQLMQKNVESDSYLEKMNHMTLADIAVYARLRELQSKLDASPKYQVLKEWMQFIGKEKFFQEAEARYAKLDEEATVESIKLLNTGKFWTDLTREEQSAALKRLLKHYNEKLSSIDAIEQEKLSKKQANAEQDEELSISRYGKHDMEAYQKAIKYYERSLNALQQQALEQTTKSQ